MSVLDDASGKQQVSRLRGIARFAVNSASLEMTRPVEVNWSESES